MPDNGSPCTLPGKDRYTGVFFRHCFILSLSTFTLTNCVVLDSGLDYVSHDDVVPYTKISNEPFGNVLLSHFVIPPNGETQGQC